MTQHFDKLLWFAELMLKSEYGLTKRQIDEAWQNTGFADKECTVDEKVNGETITRVILPRTTMYRYIDELEEFLNIKISCNKRSNTWSVDKSNIRNYGAVIRQLCEVIDMLDGINDEKKAEEVAASISDVEPIYGTGDFSQVINAVKDRKIVRFNVDGSGAMLALKPYGLKKLNHEWFVVGVEDMPEAITTIIQAYPLETMHLIEVTERIFDEPADFNINKHYGDFVGPLTDFTIPKQHILIKTDKDTGRHLDYHKIHQSQELINTTSDTMTFKLNLRPTEAFYRAILQYGSAIEVIMPDSVRERITEEAEKIVSRYHKL